MRLDDNPAYISGGVVFADNTTFLINSLLHHFNYVSADALLISTLSYGMTQKTCHRLSSRASGPAVLAVDFSNLLLLMGNNMNNSGTTTQDSYSLRLGPDFTVKIVAAYRATLQQARQRGVNLRLAIIEHIVSTPSCVLPVAEIAAEVKSFFPEAWVVVDGAHSLGSLPLNLASREWAQVDAFVTNGHKWLYTCRGCAVMWTRHSDILPIITSSATVFPDIAEERCEVAWSNESSLWGVNENFTYIGTRDNSAILSVTGALLFRQHTDRLCMLYQRALAVFAAVYLSKVWSTHIAGGLDRMTAMANVALPGVTSRQEADHLKGRVLVQHKMYIQPFPFLGAWYIRVSCPIYITKADIFLLADTVLEYTDGASVTAAAVTAARAAAEAHVEAECGSEYALHFPNNTPSLAAHQ